VLNKRLAIEHIKRIHLYPRNAQPPRAFREISPATDQEQAYGRRTPGIALDRKARGNQRGRGATERGNPRHERIAI
jgi:hypothetical protein